MERGPSIRTYLSNGAPSFTLVPDNSRSGAYIESARGCSYILHIASPLPSQPGDLVSQAIAGTRAALEAAEATSSVKRVVFTQSTSGMRPFDRFFMTDPVNQALISGKADEVPAMTADTKVPNQSPVPDDAPGELRYGNSKIACINLVREYATSRSSGNSHFSTVNLFPGWILGPEELARSKKEAFKGSNIILSWLFQELHLGPIIGLGADEDIPVPNTMVHLDDVVEAHVKALDTEKVPGKHRDFLLCSDGPAGPVLMDAADIVRRELPRGGRRQDPFRRKAW